MIAVIVKQSCPKHACQTGTMQHWDLLQIHVDSLL